MRSRTAKRLAWGLWSVAIAFAALAVVFLILGRATPPPEGTFGFRGFSAVFAVAFGTVGALIASRQPRNPIGWLLLAIGISSGFQELANQYAIYALIERGGAIPLGEVAAWFPAWSWIPGTSLTMFILFLFPDGHLPSPAGAGSSSWVWPGCSSARSASR